MKLIKKVGENVAIGNGTDGMVWLILSRHLPYSKEGDRVS